MATNHQAEATMHPTPMQYIGTPTVPAGVTLAQYRTQLARQQASEANAVRRAYLRHRARKAASQARVAHGDPL